MTNLVKVTELQCVRAAIIDSLAPDSVLFSLHHSYWEAHVSEATNMKVLYKMQMPYKCYINIKEYDNLH